MTDLIEFNEDVWAAQEKLIASAHDSVVIRAPEKDFSLNTHFKF